MVSQHTEMPAVLGKWSQVLDERVRLVMIDYKFHFYARLLVLSGEPVRDHVGQVVDLLVARWDQDFHEVWNDIYRLTGGLVRQMVLGSAVVDETSKRGRKWSHFLGKAEARKCNEQTPLQLLVLLTDWW